MKNTKISFCKELPSSILRRQRSKTTKKRLSKAGFRGYQEDLNTFDSTTDANLENIYYLDENGDIIMCTTEETEY